MLHRCEGLLLAKNLKLERKRHFNIAKLICGSHCLREGRGLAELASLPRVPVPFSRTEQNIRNTEWEDLGVKVNGRYLHDLGFAGDIAPSTPNIVQAEQMLAKIDSARRTIME
ncbi:hypothetical protein V3C99_008893 [Haemonchus contortus]|uniref:Uncharacterized protein n=1 Tax=Haemonchus contortus TaxID=6289 RepID=A0A7I4YJX2_HAECO